MKIVSITIGGSIFLTEHHLAEIKNFKSTEKLNEFLETDESLELRTKLFKLALKEATSDESDCFVVIDELFEDD